MPQWSPGSFRGTQLPTPNSIGRQGMGMLQPYVPPDPTFRSPYAMGQSDRPYEGIGKMTLSFGAPLERAAESATATRGLIEGFGAGAGRTVGGLFGPGGAQTGADIGQFVGKVAQAPFDIAGGALGKIPAIPMLNSPGMRLLAMSEEERQQVVRDWDGNPFSLFRYMGPVDKDEWENAIATGRVNPLLRPFGGAENLGDQLLNTLGVMGIPSNIVQRGIAGANGRFDTIMAAKDEDLPSVVRDLREQYKAGQLNEDQFLDLLVDNNAGYSDEWWVNLALSMALDPALITGGISTAGGLASKGARGVRAIALMGELGAKDAASLADDAAEVILKTTGKVVERESITPLQMMEAAESRGAEFAPQLAAATEKLPAHSRAALAPGFRHLERVADVTASVLDPFRQIGRRGTKPLENAYVSRQATKGWAHAYGLPNYTAVSDRFRALGRGTLFDRAAGYATAQQAMNMAGDSLREDVQKVRRIASHRPTDLSGARAKVGAENFDAKMERWTADRKLDLTRPTGLETAEAALLRGQQWALGRLTRMGFSTDEAAVVIRGLDGDGLSLIDGLYFGWRIEKYNKAMAGAREYISSRAASARKPSARIASLQNIIDRATLIGPHELTDLRARALRAALDANDAQAARDAVRQYDRLAMEIIADGRSDGEVIARVKTWLDDFEDGLTKEVDRSSLPPQLADDVADDGYIYGLRPETGTPEWRLKFDDEGNIISANPWIDIVGDAAQPWNLRFGGSGKVQNLLGSLEQVGRQMTHQITTDRIDREARRDFINTAINGLPGTSWKKGLTYEEGRTLFTSVKERALEAGTTPRGLSLRDFDDILKRNPALRAAGIEATDVMSMTLRAYQGRLGTVGLSQKFTGGLKRAGGNLPLLPENIVGQMAERMFPLVRFSINPFFQLQEWVEPWLFSAARGRLAMHAGKKAIVDPITGETITVQQLDQLGQHLINRYRASNPEAMFDMMERSLVYLHGQRAASEISSGISQNGFLRRLVGMPGSPADRKQIAQNIQFREHLGQSLKEQFDRINPRIWTDLQQEFGTTDAGAIALRWADEKDVWASADPGVAYHRLGVQKRRDIGATQPVSIGGDAVHVFNTTREGLVLDVQRGIIDYDGYKATMSAAGVDAHPDYIERAWKALQFEARTGGIDQWLKDYGVLFGEDVATHTRALVESLSAVQGISPTEFLSRHLSGSPVSLLHDDLIALSADDIAAQGVQFQQAERAAALWTEDEAGNLVHIPYASTEEGEAAFTALATKPPSFLPPQDAAMLSLERVQFGTGRSLLVPGGTKALADLETPWTMWEAQVLRSQLIDPVEALDPALKHAIYEKTWRGHTFDMADPENVWRVHNNMVMAMLSAGLNLTRNEAVATRLRVSSLADLRRLSDEARGLQKTIRDATGEVDHADLGLAYSTQRNVAHYIPLDARETYYGQHMLPERTSLKKATGAAEATIPVRVEGTQALIERRANAANGYLERTSKDRRAYHGTLEQEVKAEAKVAKKQKWDGRLTFWATEEAAEAIARGGIGGLDSLEPILGAVRPGKVKPEAIEAIEAAAKRLVEDPSDRAARDVVRQVLTNKVRDLDDAVVWKPWNVNGAGAPYTKMPNTGQVTGHGDAGLYAYLKNDDVVWRGASTSTNLGRSLAMAQDMVDNPGWYVRRADEPLDEFAERILHRTDGLSLKTGYFGVDLGDPMAFNRGVMDTHMVGELTEFMHARGGKAWTAFYESLSTDMRNLIDKWLARGAPRGAGNFDWSEATGRTYSFKTGAKKQRDELTAAVRMGDDATVARWVRGKIELFDEPDRSRLLRMYRDDAELASLYGRDIQTLSGDYRIYDDLMSEHRAERAAAGEPGLDRHGNGGYQWKLWDDRRHVFDPELATFARAHDLPNRSIKYMAFSDDANYSAGMMNRGGLKPVSELGARYLDPRVSMLAQMGTTGRDAATVIRGATLFDDMDGAIIGATQFANKTTGLHELTHAAIEPLLDPSGRQVVLDDLNEAIRADNARLVVETDEARELAEQAAVRVREHEAALATASREAQEANAAVLKATRTATRVEKEADRLTVEATKQEGVLSQLQKDAPTRHKDIDRATEPPSWKTRRHASVDNAITRQQAKVDALRTSRDEARRAVAPAWDEVTPLQATATSKADDVDIISTNLRARKAEGYEAKKAYDEIAVRPPKDIKYGWDRETSEHLADQFLVWLSTGKAKNSKLRDLFAFMRKTLASMKEYALGRGAKVSPQMDDLFQSLTNSKVTSIEANAVQFDATQEMMHAALIQSVMDAEDAAFTNVQFRRGRSWIERSFNHPYFAMYPTSYMWGKVAPEMVRALAINPFGLPVPFLTHPVKTGIGAKTIMVAGKPVRIGGMEIGMHGSPFMGYVNAQRVNEAIELQKDTDPEFAAQVNDPQNEKVFRNLMMFLPGTPWDLPANFPLWMRRWAEWGLESQDRAADGRPLKKFDLPKTAGEVASYAFGPKATFDWLSDMAKIPEAPFMGGEAAEGLGGATPQLLTIQPQGMDDTEAYLRQAGSQLQERFGGIQAP